MNLILDKRKEKMKREGLNHTSELSPLESDYHKRSSPLATNSLNQSTSQIGYEEQMQQYEADIRNHISIEQQLKIYIDNLKYKMECDEKDFEKKEMQLAESIAQLQKDKARLDELISLKDRELDGFRTEVKALAEQVRSSEAKQEKLKRETL